MYPAIFGFKCLIFAWGAAIRIYQSFLALDWLLPPI